MFCPFAGGLLSVSPQDNLNEKYTGGQKELLKLHCLGNEGLQQWLSLNPMPKQSISDHFNVPLTIFDRAPVILRNFLWGNEDVFLVPQEITFNGW